MSVPTGVIESLLCDKSRLPPSRAALRARAAHSLPTDTRACLTMAAAAGLEASRTKVMSPTRNGVPLPYPTGIAPLNLQSRDGGLVLALTAIVIAAATQNGCIRTQLLSATVEYQTDALFQRSLRPAEKGRPELAPQRGGESAAPRESPHSLIANGRSDSSGSPNRQRRKFHRRRRAAATTATAATALPGVIATDGVIAIDGVIAALSVIRATNTNGAIIKQGARHTSPAAPSASKLRLLPLLLASPPPSPSS